VTTPVRPPSWPRDGVPTKPDAWLLTVARRRLIDVARHSATAAGAVTEMTHMMDGAHDAAASPVGVPDERLRLLFVCAHPAIDEAVRTPLMLQTVLGLDAARIAAAFVVTPATMSQRLVRAKAKIRDAAIRFEVPERHELPERLDAVLDAIYAAYGSGWEDVAGADPRRRGLTGEAIWLGRLAAALLPDEPETHGLLALMLHCEARRGARRDAAGAYVPLAHQDVTQWSGPLIDEAEESLTRASQANRPGRFQLEAAIQSVHAHRAVTGRTDWEAIALLYEGLLQYAATVGARVARAAALAEARGVDEGLAALTAVPMETIATYQPYWALRAHLLARAGRVPEARETYARAAALTEDDAVRAFLDAQVPGGKPRHRPLR
jgi:RNA polymerase sigma-70 factor (ECF subfamily)